LKKTVSNASLISIGLCPEKSLAWNEGSYKYQANSKKSYFVSGARRQDNYGVYFRMGNVIGCKWNKEEKTISFTRDGEDLGVAFRDIVPTHPLVPAVGIGTGVRIRVNFGQEVFLYNVKIQKEKEQNLDAETLQKRKQEEEVKRKKEKEEEDVRRKKEQEDLEHQRREQAKPITGMGYTINQALAALAATGYSGTENAVMWLLENPEAGLVEPPKPEIKAEEKKEIIPEVKDEKPITTDEIKDKDKDKDKEKEKDPKKEKT